MALRVTRRLIEWKARTRATDKCPPRKPRSSQALTGKNLCPTATPNCDPLGRPVMEGTIYNPATTRLVNGQLVRDPFQNNIIDRSFWDPVAVKVQALLPAANRSGLINNYLNP